jgi:hypothetical protein
LLPSSGSNSKPSKEQQHGGGKQSEPCVENPALYKPKGNYEIHSEDGSDKFLRNGATTQKIVLFIITAVIKILLKQNYCFKK